MQLKKSRWFTPYTMHNGRLVPAIRDCWTCAQAGVYFIRNARSGKICYIGHSTTQLKKTIYRHFQQWTDRSNRTNRQFERKTYPKTGYEIRFIKCSMQNAARLEAYLINKLRPKDNPIKYDNLSTSDLRKGEALETAVNSEAIVLNKADYWIGMEEAPF